MNLQIYTIYSNFVRTEREFFNQMAKKIYKYDPEKALYVLQREPVRVRAYRHTRSALWGFIFASTLIFFYSSTYYTPKMQRIMRETDYLNNCKTPYLLLDISALSGLKYAYVDLDGDSRKEIIIDCGDTIILRYYQGIVYHYDFTFRQMYNLNTDASFAYTSSSGYGQRKLFFDGSVIKTNTLWEVVNEVAENTTYYLGGELSTADAITSYIAENPKTAIEFAPLEVSWQNKVSQAEALKIAEEYWKDFDIEKNFYSVALSEDSSAPQNVYVFSISRPVEGSHYSVFDTVWIDKNTAEIIIPYSDGKG